MSIGEQAAFPRPASEYTAGGTLPDGNDAVQGQRGMTFREWLAGVALQGLVARPLVDLGASVKDRAEVAVAYADALIEELSKPNAQLDA
jgi:hypothetical protein